MTPDQPHISPPVATAEQLPDFALRWAFFLDVDGTLAQLARTPDAVTIEPEVLATIGRLMAVNDGAVALITGRAIADIDGLFAPLQLPVAGQHGIERRSANGRLTRHADVARRLDTARAALAEFAAAHEGLIFEDKGETLALHYRRAPALQPVVRRFMDAQMDQLDGGFTLQWGKMVFEIRPSGQDKGTAIGEFMQEPPFAGRLPVFIGDDKTDEDGFAVVNRLGGHAIKVGRGVTAAPWRLSGAAAVSAWLRDYVAFIEAMHAKGSK